MIQIHLNPKFLPNKNSCGPKIIYDPQFFLPYFFRAPNDLDLLLFWTSYFFGFKFFWTKGVFYHIIFTQNCFTQNFFGLKYFWTQIFLEQDFIDRNRNLGIKTTEQGLL